MQVGVSDGISKEDGAGQKMEIFFQRLNSFGAQGCWIWWRSGGRNSTGGGGGGGYSGGGLKLENMAVAVVVPIIQERIKSILPGRMPGMGK